jgi:FkbM family methyltransferase
MRKLLEEIAEHPRVPTWDTLVWAGVGHGADLPAVRKLPASRRVYLEPHPALFARLQSKTHAGSGNETLLPLALWRDDHGHAFHRLSNPLKSSLLPPERLMERMPNLKLAGTDQVDTVGLDGLVDRLGLHDGGSSLLILDVAGAELPVLLEASRRALGAFEGIVVRAAEDGDYAGASPLSETASLLFRLGYRVEAESAAEHALLLLRDAAVWAERERIESERSSLQQQVAELSAHVQRLSREAIGLDSERERLSRDATERGQRVDALTAHIQAQDAQLQDQAARMLELSEHATGIGGERDRFAQLAGELEQRIEALDAHIQAQDAQLQDQAARMLELSELATEIGGARDRFAQLAGELEQRIEALTAHIEAQDAHLKQQAEQMLQLSEHASELGSARDRFAQEAAALTNEVAWLKQHGAELGSARLHHANLAHERQLQVEALTDNMQAQELRLAGLKERAAELAAESEGLARLAGEREQQIRELQGHAARAEQLHEEEREQQVRELQGHAARAEQLREEIFEANQAAALSLKLQAMREADLRELQERYQASLSVQERQHQMLVKLGERLSIASRYFHQMAEGQAELLVDATGENPAKAKAKAKPRPATRAAKTSKRAVPAAPAKRRGDKAGRR